MLALRNKANIKAEQKCIVRLLDDDEVLECGFQGHHKGQFLVDAVCQQLNIIEKDYFGLRYVDPHKQRHWLDVTKHIVKQVKNLQPIVFCFRVKFYPHDPYKLKEELTRYQIFLQLRRDLQHGRLYCSQVDAQQLAAYIVQSELGDYDGDEHIGNYISGMKLLLKQSEDIEVEILKLHRTLKGQVPAAAETNFLRKACLLETYGVDPHPVKDHKGNQLYLGINHSGIVTFQGARKTNHVKWAEIQKINYEGKMFIVHFVMNDKKHTVGFKCQSTSACRHVWRCSVEQQLFFTLPSSSAAPPVVTGGSFFSRGSRFRYSGRTERELRELSVAISQEPPFGMRNSSIQRRGNSVPITTSNTVDSALSRPNAPYSSPLKDDVLCGDSLPMNSPYDTHRQVPPRVALDTLNEDLESRKNTHNDLLRESPPCGTNYIGDIPPRISDYAVESVSNLIGEGVTTLKVPDIRCNGEIIHPGPLKDSFEDLHEGEYLLPLPRTLEVGDSPRTSNHTSLRMRMPTTSLDDMAIPDRVSDMPVKFDASPLPVPKKQKPSYLESPLLLHLRNWKCFSVLLPVFGAVLLLVFGLLVIVFETDLGGIKKMPELILLKRGYYDPFKRYFLRWY